MAIVLQTVVKDDLALQKKAWQASRRRVLNFGSPLVAILIWQILDMLHVLNQSFIPAPTAVAAAMIQDATSGQLWSDLRVSLTRIALGFVIAVVPGILIGLSSGLFPVVRMFVDPIVSATYSIPKLALAPLFMLVFGLTETEKILLIASGAIFPVIINTMAGVLDMDKKYMDVAENFGASRFAYYKTVALPGSLPYIFGGLKMALAESLLLIVAAEMIGAESGIGYRIWMSYDVMNMPMMFVSFIVIAVLGHAFSSLLDEALHWLIPWHRSDIIR